MDNQKIVVVLLLITIILSVVSVVVTMSVGGGDASEARETMRITEDDSSGTVGFEIINPPTGGTG